MITNYYAMTDESISNELGKRVERLRLEHSKQLTQSALAKEAGISRSTYQKIIEGKGTIVNLISLLRVLDGLDNLDSLLPEKPLSPVQLLKLKGNVRKRVRPSSVYKLPRKDEEDLDW